MRIVDAHLDLAYNAARGRDPRLLAKDQPVVDNEIVTVGLPDLREGGVELICATIFCRRSGYGKAGYTTADEARQQALSQLRWYRQVQAEDELLITRGTGGPPVSSDNERDHRRAAHATRAILLLEGADALR